MHYLLEEQTHRFFDDYIDVLWHLLQEISCPFLAVGLAVEVFVSPQFMYYRQSKISSASPIFWLLHFHHGVRSENWPTVGERCLDSSCSWRLVGVAFLVPPDAHPW